MFQVVHDFYGTIVGCPLSCTGILRDETSNIPRGFYTQAKPGDIITLMVVGINPGQVMSDEINLYANPDPKEKARIHLQFADRVYTNNAGKRFHKRLLNWLSNILQKPQEVVFQETVYTNLVKCTTPNNKMPSLEVGRTCFSQNFQRELNFWKPKAVIALGVHCDSLLTKLGIPHDFLPHPSHHETRDYHLPFCEKIRSTLGDS